MDHLSSLLADQGRRYQNHPAARAGRLAHPAGPRLHDRDRPSLDNSHPAALALPPALAVWHLALWGWSCFYRRRTSLRRLGAQHLGSNWSRSVTIKQSHELITTGPYALVRHPIYTGILTGFLGTAIALSQVRGFIAFVLVFLVFWAKLRMEEEWMRCQFGETYATYVHQTAALVPYLF